MPVLRSRDDRMIAGARGALAKALGWSSTAVRPLYVIVSLLSVAFPGTRDWVLPSSGVLSGFGWAETTGRRRSRLRAEMAMGKPNSATITEVGTAQRPP